MAGFRTVMKVLLGRNHFNPGRTRHEVADAQGIRRLPPFVRLEIAQYSGDPSYYLLHVCEDGQTADTNHGTIQEAMHQAEWEFGVQQNEWEIVESH
jgi:hypothetical protein